PVEAGAADLICMYESDSSPFVCFVCFVVKNPNSLPGHLAAARPRYALAGSSRLATRRRTSVVFGENSPKIAVWLRDLLRGRTSIQRALGATRRLTHRTPSAKTSLRSLPDSRGKILSHSWNLL
ncbi:MAG: hypothetical protein ACLQVF_44185, partial [Isosphaeraceae bacterium]